MTSRAVPISKIDRSPWADLFPSTEEERERLTDDVAERGILTPLHVYRHPATDRYELLTGHDRLGALQRVLAEGRTEKLPTDQREGKVPVAERSTLTSEEERFGYFLRDNTVRKDVNKRAIAKEVQRRYPEWSVRMVAEFAGVSVGIAHGARAELEGEGWCSPVNTIGKDGVAQPSHKPVQARVPAMVERPAARPSPASTGAEQTGNGFQSDSRGRGPDREPEVEAGAHDADVVAELETAHARITELEGLLESLKGEDRASEVTRWWSRSMEAERKGREAAREAATAKRVAKRRGDLLKKVRKLLRVQKDEQIVGRLEEVVRGDG